MLVFHRHRPVSAASTGNSQIKLTILEIQNNITVVATVILVITTGLCTVIIHIKRNCTNCGYAVALIPYSLCREAENVIVAFQIEAYITIQIAVIAVYRPIAKVIVNIRCRNVANSICTSA